MLSLADSIGCLNDEDVFALLLYWKLQKRDKIPEGCSAGDGIAKGVEKSTFLLEVEPRMDSIDGLFSALFGVLNKKDSDPASVLLLPSKLRGSFPEWKCEVTLQGD